MGDFWNKVFKVTAEKGEIFLFRKSPQIFKPGRMGEVPQSHAGVDPRLFEKLQLIQITVQGLFIVYAVFRFDTAPLDGKTIGLMFELLEKADVLFVKLLTVAGLACRDNVGIGTLQLLFPALAVKIITFDLVSGGGAAPEETFGEGIGGHLVKIQHFFASLI